MKQAHTSITRIVPHVLKKPFDTDDGDDVDLCIVDVAVGMVQVSIGWSLYSTFIQNFGAG